LFTTPRAATFVPDVPENEIFNNTENEVWALVNTLPRGYYDVNMCWSGAVAEGDEAIIIERKILLIKINVCVG
jgi:hypothetical protein